MSSSYKEGNGVRASEDELPCSLSIKLPFFLSCISSFSGALLDSNRFTWQEQKKKQNTSTFLSFVPSFLLFLFRILHVQGFLLPSPRCYPFVTASSLLYSLKPRSEAGAVQLFPRSFPSCFHTSPVQRDSVWCFLTSDNSQRWDSCHDVAHRAGNSPRGEIQMGFKRRKSSNVNTKTRSVAFSAELFSAAFWISSRKLVLTW